MRNINKILIIDNIDSFVYNIFQYLGEVGKEYGVKPVVVLNNTDKEKIDSLIEKSCGIVISPGPKTPEHAGISNYVIKKYFKEKPILGICLGHQCIGHVFNAKIKRAKILKHGKTSLITHKNEKIFKGVPTIFEATRYHSLIIDKKSLKKPLKEIAYSLDDNEIMAIKHENYDVYGVQIHPESIITREGKKIIKNFVEICVNLL